MTELQEQLAALRRRMARTLEECAEKYEKPRLPGFRNTPVALFEHRETAIEEDFPEARSENKRFPEARPESIPFHVEEWLPGEEVETAARQALRNGKALRAPSPPWQRRYRSARRPF